MATPEPLNVAGLPHAAERRLHPMSWLFVLLQQLKQFVVPLVALVFFGRGGDRYEWMPLIGVGVLVLVSLWRYYTYRYGVVGENLVVRSGLLERSLRVIPFARIHNVALEQSVLHRLFGVAEVRLESAGGKKPEAEMRVLTLADALALERLVRHRGAVPTGAIPTYAGDDAGASTAADGAADVDAAPSTLLTLPLGEVLRHGLVSNRGMIVFAAGFATLSQFGGPSSSGVGPRMFANLVRRWGGEASGYADSHGYGPLQYALFAAGLFAALLVLLRLLSMVLALLQFYGFRLSEHGRRLTVERGLLARWRTSASRRRIQAWTLREGVLHRLLKRRSLEVDTAVAEEGQQQQRALRELAPIATPADCDRLIDHLLPRAHWPELAWQALPTHHWWRLLLPQLPFVAIATMALSWRFGAAGALALLWLPWAMFVARQHARRAAYAVNAELVAVRAGWWTRSWRFAEIDKLQALQLSRSPLDRRCGTATLALDTSGASPLAPPLRVRFLPVDEAYALHEQLAAELARRPLRW